MKKIMLFAFCAAAFSVFAVAPAGRRIIVRNTIDVARPCEIISVKWSDAGVTADDTDVRVWDVRANAPVPFQDDMNGNVIFPAALSPLETRMFVIYRDGKLPQADLSTVCWAKHIPERMDDFAWENDCFAARAYGPGVMQPAPKGEGLVSSGIDMYCKCVPYPVMGTWLSGKGPGSYHTNHGEGMDNYKVAKGRGTGGIASLIDGKWGCSSNWVESRVLMTGPVRAVFELVYAPWGGYGREVRRVTIDRGRCLAKFEVMFETAPETGFVGPGLDVSGARNHAGDIRMSLENAWIANFEPKDGAAGSYCTAIMLDPSMGKARMASDAFDCLCLMVKARKKVTYWAGGAWSGAGYFVAADLWHMYVKDFAAALKTPVKVTVR